MNCQIARDSIVGASGRPLSAPEVEDHLRGCAACVKVRDEQVALWSALEDWTAPEVSPGFDARLLRRLEARPARV